jgi:hypothetical protein
MIDSFILNGVRYNFQYFYLTLLHTRLNWLRMESSDEHFWHRNVPSGSKKDEEFFDHLSYYYLHKNDSAPWS